MFPSTMDWDSITTDQLEQQLLKNRELRSRLDALDLEILEELDRRQIATADGSRSMQEWVAARLDVGPDTAKRLVGTMRRTCDRPDLREALADGVSLDRVEALSRISEEVGLWLAMDIAAVRREAAKRSRLTAEEESRGV
ncbi:MAG: hypothetical protein ACE5F5_08955, partial [Acidimicrobiia bacterium]